MPEVVARAQSPPSALRGGAALSRWSARSATPPACASAACGSDRRSARRTPGSCASGGETPSVDDAIAIALKRRPDVVFGLGTKAASCVGGFGRLRREDLALACSSCCRIKGIAPEGSWAVRPAARCGNCRRWSARDRQTSRVCPDRRPGDARPATSRRHVLTGMVRARRRRIVAVIGGDHEHVGLPQTRQDERQPIVEPLEIVARTRRRRYGDRTCVSKSTRFAKTSPASSSRIAEATASIAGLVAGRGHRARDAAPREQV